MIFVLTLVVAQIFYALGVYGTQSFNFSPSAAQVLDILAQVFDIAFACILSILMKGVNEQLALFSKQVGMGNYRKYSIAAFISANFMIVVHWDALRIFTYYFKINKVYYYLSAWLNNIIYFMVYLVVTGVFYILADFGFEARTH